MQCYNRIFIFGNTMKARALPQQNRGMDQRVCAKQNDTPRHADIRESLENGKR